MVSLGMVDEELCPALSWSPFRSLSCPHWVSAKSWETGKWAKTSIIRVGLTALVLGGGDNLSVSLRGPGGGPRAMPSWAQDRPFGGRTLRLGMGKWGSEC